jgi:hypothetical protein
MLLTLDILLNQLVEEVGIAMFDDTDDLIPRNLMVARGKELRYLPDIKDCHICLTSPAISCAMNYFAFLQRQLHSK